MGHSPRINRAVLCPYCTSNVWDARRRDIDAARRPVDLVARVFAGRPGKHRVHGTWEVVWRSASELPAELGRWVRDRAVATIRTWLSQGVLSATDLDDLAYHRSPPAREVIRSELPFSPADLRILTTVPGASHVSRDDYHW